MASTNSLYRKRTGPKSLSERQRRRLQAPQVITGQGDKIERDKVRSLYGKPIRKKSDWQLNQDRLTLLASRNRPLYNGVEPAVRNPYFVKGEEETRGPRYVSQAEVDEYDANIAARKYPTGSAMSSGDAAWLDMDETHTF